MSSHIEDESCESELSPVEVLVHRKSSSNAGVLYPGFISTLQVVHEQLFASVGRRHVLRGRF